MALIKKIEEEGEIFNRWLRSRLIVQNKNVISAELGGTGSGKSYRDLRKLELWYQFYFKEKAPVENICFHVGDVFKLLSSGNLKRGEIIILEEAGVNVGSRGWQNQVNKLFNHVLQSFRSMNIGLFLNLPYLSMLDKQARHLLHYYAESVGVDQEKGLNTCKPFFVQVAQGTGKIYRHYPKVKSNGKTVKVKRFEYSMPSKYLIDGYEQKKAEYLKSLIGNYADKLNIEVKKTSTPKQIEFDAYQLSKIEKNQRKVGEILEISQQSVSNYVRNVEEWLKVVKNKRKGEAVWVSTTKKPLQIPTNPNQS